MTKLLEWKVSTDLNVEIDAELRTAKAKYGSNNFELLCLEGSRGDTIDDEQLLEMLKRFNETGSGYGRILLQTERPGSWQRLVIRLRSAVLPWLAGR